MGNVFKKVFSTVVTLTTVMSTVGVGTLVAPVASAATLAGGDLIKASTPAVYYYAGNGKRYVFPNEKTYFSWFADFSSVKTITDAELAAIQIGGNVTIRQGTKLVKITTDPKVYAVTKGGVLHWVESEAVAVTLYGANWAQRVVDVPDGFFTNYTVGSSVSTAVHPDGSLVSYQGSADRYVVANGQKRKLADTAFAANGYQASDVLMTTVVYPNGTDVAAREGDLADVVVGTGGVGGVTPPTAPAGTLSVALATDTPAGATVPKNAVSVQILKVNLTANNGNVVVSGLKFHRVGIGATTDFSNVYIYDANGTRLTTGRTLNSTTNVVEFNALNYTIPAGQTNTYVLVGDFSTPGTTGGQHAFEFADAAAVVVSGSGTVGGTFPVRGNVFTVGTTSAATVTVTKGTNPSNPNIGSVDTEIANFKLAASTNDVEVRRVTLYQTGTITNSDVTNMKLYQGTTLVAQAASISSDGHITLNFTTPYALANGQTKVFSLKGTVGGRSSRTIRTYVEYAGDVYAIDKVYSSGAAVDIGTSGTYDGTNATSDCATVGNSSCITTQGGTLTVSFDGPTAQNISKGQQDVPLYKFSLTSQEGQLEVRYVNFKIASTNGGMVIASDATILFTDVKVKDLDTGETVAGPVTLTASASGAATSSQMAPAGPIFVNGGQTRHLAVTADTYNLASTHADYASFNNKQYIVQFGNQAGSYLFSTTDVRIVSTGEFLAQAKIVSNSLNNGSAQTVAASNLTVALSATPASSNFVKKQTGINTAGFNFIAGTQNDVRVTAVNLTGTGSMDGGTTYAVTNFDLLANACRLYDGTIMLGTAQNPDTTLGTMNFTNLSVLIPKGSTKALTVKCDISSNVSSTLDRIAVYLTPSTAVTAEDADSNTITPSPATAVNSTPTIFQTLRATGTLTVATESLRGSTILVAGGDTWQNMAQFKATAQYEGMTLDQIQVTSTGNAANFSAVGVMKDGAVLGFQSLGQGTHQSVMIDLTGHEITVPKDGSATFQLVARLSNISASTGASNVARTGQSLQLGIGAGLQTPSPWNSNYSGNFNVHAVGAASGDVVYASGSTSQGNAFINRKAKPVVTKQAGTTALNAGVAMEVAKFTVGSNDPSVSIGLKKMTFTFSKTIQSGSTASFNMGSFKLRKGGTDMATTDYNIYTTSTAPATGSAGGMTDLSAAATIASSTASGYVIVTFTNEETVSGSGNMYTVVATAAGTLIAGDSFTMQWTADASSNVAAGYLNNFLNTDNVRNLDTSASADTADTVANFLWSDLSEVPHAYATGTSGSYDWTNGYLVETLTDSWSVSK